MCEGTLAYPPLDGTEVPCAVEGLAAPVAEYGHDPACTVIGGYVYRGGVQQSLAGRYVFGDFCSGQIWAIPADVAAGKPLPAPLDTALRITSFGEDATGELYVADWGGRIMRLVDREPLPASSKGDRRARRR